MSALQRSFKIRKSSKRVREEDTQEDRREALNLNHMHLANRGNSDQSQQKQKQLAQFQSSLMPRTSKRQYDGSEDNVECYRFPHMKFCGCPVGCLYTAFEIFEVVPKLYICAFESGTKTRNLLENGITHILNLTSKEYTKRTRFFDYLNIDIHNNSEEDVKKFFRITNRFIQGNKNQEGNILIQSVSIALSACFALSYLIGVKKIPIKGSMEIAKRNVPNLEIAPHFLKQLESYDLEKLAFVTIKRQV